MPTADEKLRQILQQNQLQAIKKTRIKYIILI